MLRSHCCSRPLSHHTHAARLSWARQSHALTCHPSCALLDQAPTPTSPSDAPTTRCCTLPLHMNHRRDHGEPTPSKQRSLNKPTQSLLGAVSRVALCSAGVKLSIELSHVRHMQIMHRDRLMPCFLICRTRLHTRSTRPRMHPSLSKAEAWLIMSALYGNAALTHHCTSGTSFCRTARSGRGRSSGRLHRCETCSHSVIRASRPSSVFKRASLK
jgi:hypothetical protein